MKTNSRFLHFCLLAFLIWTSQTRAGRIYVPDFSFETPAVPDQPPFADPEMDYWQETPQPDYYNPAEFDDTPWSDLIGEFYNDPEDGAYIGNADGVQCGFLQNLPEVGIFQDYNSFSSTQAGPTHAFNATFQPGHCYYLTAGVIGGGGGMPAGATLQLSLYYRDASNNIVTVASRTITNSLENFPNNTNFVDFQLDVPSVLPEWAGKNIGIEILCTVDFTTYGGYWDIDNVRLVEAQFVPNFSFETPAVPDEPPYAAPYMDSWVETPQPDYYDPAEFDDTPWSDLVGEFYNDTNDGAYIINADGVQCGFLQNLPEVGIYQTVPSTYNVGKGYSLSVDVLGGGGDMPPGAPLLVSLYYLDASNNMVTVASETVVNTPQLFPSNTNFVSFQLQVPPVKPTDPWAGKNIGIELFCASDFTTYGGYWDVDNVILSETVGPTITNPALSNGQLNFTVQSEPQTIFNILGSTNLSQGNWSSIGSVTNVTGSVPFAAPTNAPQQFYLLRQM